MFHYDLYNQLFLHGRHHGTDNAQRGQVRTYQAPVRGRRAGAGNIAGDRCTTPRQAPANIREKPQHRPSVHSS